MSRWTKETFKNYWRSKSASNYWDNEWNVNSEMYLKEFKPVLSRLKKIKWRNLLELGCGVGKNMLEIKKNFKENNIFGFDINIDFIEKAKKKGLKVWKMDSEHFTLKKLPNIILCYEHLQHLHPEAFKETVNKITNNASYVLLYEGFNGKDEDVLKSGEGGRWSYDYLKYFPHVIYKKIDKEKKYILLLSELI